jgi:hypothetical protein
MADFKLDRIKFRWAGDWQTNRAYRKDDVVRYMGKAYVALDNHTGTLNFYDSRDTLADVTVVVTAGASSIKTGQNVYLFDGVEQHTQVMNKGRKYIFDQSPPLTGSDTNLKLGGAVTTDEETGVESQADNPHYLQFSSSPDGLHNGGDVWTDGIVYKINNELVVDRAAYIAGFAAATSRTIEVTLPETGPAALYYYCEAHPGMGGKMDTRYTSMWELMFDGYAWKTDWEIGTFYSEGDIVKYGGYIYQCIISHTSSPVISLGLPVNADNWIIYQTTYNWLEEWTINTYYDLGDVVCVNGVVYICTEKHQSAATSALGLAADIANWSIITRSDSWRGDWTVSTVYSFDDVARYGGIVYRANTQHTSAADFNLGLEDDSALWNAVHIGIDYKGIWVAGTRYKLNDVVKYGGGLWICSTAHGAGAASLRQDELNWTEWVPGFEYEAEWSNDIEYNKGDIVKYGGYTYTAILNNSGSIPSANLLEQDTGDWEILRRGYNHLGDWNDITAYRTGDVVRAGGYLYLAIKDNQTLYPDELFTLKDANEGRTAYASVIQEIASGSYPTQLHSFWASTNPETGFAYADLNRNGQVDEDDVNLAEGDGSTGYNEPLAYIIQQAQDAYRAGEISTYPADPNNANANVLSANSGTDTWQLLVDETNYRAEWSDNTEYLLGDIALYAGTLYRCMERHYSSNSEARPDLDQGQDHITFWEVFIQGTPTNVLVYRGDMQIFEAPTGKDRLAIGAAGQALKVITSLPTWKDYGVVKNIYYVSTDGLDLPTRGTQATSSFRTIKYAMEYINAQVETRTPATVFVGTGFFEEITPIVIPKDTALVGDELRSTNIQPVEGYEANDMFYVQNGSGIRNCTLQGLTGTLGDPNENFTRRPTAGAFVSLDPGTGPDDSSAWITNKSPYVQNVTTFGTGCIGMKVDGSLHQGGNRSIVANDFTQILSDGIGYWAESAGRSELVSVFTYYCHVGYLATNGGIVRATNGNNSYGLYGAVAEGFDVSETPITAVTNNKDNEAQVDSAFTYGTLRQEIFAIGYSNAGEDYTTATIDFGGSGELGNAVYDENEIRDGAVSNARIDARGDSTNPGGLNYTFIVNNSQGGNDSGSITLSAADIGTPALYVGQRISIVSGLGVGQYGEITAFNETTKKVIVSKESDGSLGWDHYQPGWPIEVLLDETTQYAIEPKVTFDEPIFTAEAIGTSQSADWEHMLWGNNEFLAMTNTGAVQTSADGESWTSGSGITDNVDVIGVVWTGTAYYAAVATKDNLPTDLVYSSSDGSSWSGVTASTTSENWKSISTVRGIVSVIAENGVALYHDGSSWSNSAIGLGGTGTANGWTIVRTLDNKYWVDWEAMSLDLLGAAVGLNDGEQHQFWLDIPFNETYAVGDFNANGSVTVMDANLGSQFFGTGTTVTSVQAASIESMITKAIERQIRTGDLPSNWFVQGIFVAINKNEGHIAWSSTGNYWHTLDATNITPAPASPRRAPAFECTDGAYGNNRLVLIGQETDDSAFGFVPTPYTFDGENWQLGYVEFGDYTNISYGAGVFIASGLGNFVAKSQSGATWRTYGDDSANYSLTELGTWTGSAYRAGKWIVAQSGSNTFNKISTGARPIARAKVEGSRVTQLTIYDPGSNYSSTPNVTIYDNVETIDALVTLNLRDGVLAQPTFLYRGNGYVQFDATITGDGLADIYQIGKLLKVTGLTRIPGPGANLEIDGITEVRYSISKVASSSGEAGNFTATLEITPTIDVEESPDHQTTMVIREKYSQLRLTGHDFLDIGSGNFTDTAYPLRYVEGVNEINELQPFNETVAFGGGRVFYTASDQDGNFRVGELFEVEQSTGIVTINASQFDLGGLTELSLGGIQVGGSAVVIQEFSKETTFIANSNNVVPTQKAIRAYIESRISGGGSNVQTNALVAGQVRIQTNNIDTTSGFPVIIPPVMNIQGGVDGHYLASMFYGKGT